MTFKKGHTGLYIVTFGLILCLACLLPCAVYTGGLNPVQAVTVESTSSDENKVPGKGDPFWLMMTFVPILGIATWLSCMYLARSIWISETVTHAGEAVSIIENMKRCICFANISCYGHTMIFGKAPDVESPKAELLMKRVLDGDTVSSCESDNEVCKHYCDKGEFALLPNFYFVVATAAVSLAIFVCAWGRYHILKEMEVGTCCNLTSLVIAGIGCASCVVMSLLPSNHSNQNVQAMHIYCAYGGFGLAFVYEIMHLCISWTCIESYTLRGLLTVLLIIPPVALMLWSSGGEEDYCASVGEWICAFSNYSYLLVYSLWAWKMYSGRFECFQGGKEVTSVSLLGEA